MSGIPAPETTVFVELSTTGFAPGRDAIFELAALKLTGGEGSGDMSLICDPGRPLPMAASRRTGITRADVAGAPAPEEAVAELLEFARDAAAWVSFDADSAAGFLVAASRGAFTESVLGVSDLARAILPAAAGHRLASLCRELGIPVPGGRAMERCRASAAVHAALIERLRAFDPALLAELAWVTAKERTPLARVIHAAERDSTRSGFGRKPREFIELLARDESLRKALKPGRTDAPEPGAGEARLDASAAASHLGAGSSVAAALGDYEERPEQILMAREVASALTSGTHLMVEAGTGVGKSLAYLVPVALWTSAARRPLVISTNTKNLQSQLYEKDLPVVARALKIPIRAALIKGRSNYLCVRRLEYVLRNLERELENDERSAMLSLLVWAASTATGDVAENTGFLAIEGSQSLWDKLTTIGDECMSTSCRQAARCFLRRARRTALNADVVVANHALVFSELNLDSPVLPPCEEIIFDEAHNIEDVATDHLSVRVDPPRIYRILNRLWRRRRGREGGTGLLASVHHSLGSAEGVSAERIEASRAAAQQAIELIRPAADAARAFFDSLAPLLGASAMEDQKRRYGAEKRPPDLWAPALELKKGLIEVLGGLCSALEALAEALGDLGRGKLPYGGELRRELDARLNLLREAMTDLEFVVAGAEEGYVYWVEQLGGPRAGRAGLCGAPVHVGRLLCEQLYSKKRSCILTSATLTVSGSFEFLKQRLGLDLLPEDRLKTINVGTPFNFDSQAAVYVPAFLPEPDGGEFIEELSSFLVGLFKVTQGRGLALFTSYRTLNDIYDRLHEPLESEGILVLGQGRDGSRERLLETLIRERECVLLGTSSFWEGIDVKGDALSVLVIAKLPFQVFTEPIVKARCEQVEASGADSFMGYSIPHAVLRLRQGFGRLIRSRTDRGVVVICDRRMLTRRYGPEFLRSLPTEAVPALDRGALLREIEGFLAPQQGRDVKPPRTR